MYNAFQVRGLIVMEGSSRLSDESEHQLLWAIIFGVTWLIGLLSQLALLRALLTPSARVKLRLPFPASSWLLLLGITLTDLLTTLFSIPTTVYSQFFARPWVFGVALCNLGNFLETCSISMTAFSLVALLMHAHQSVVSWRREGDDTVSSGVKESNAKQQFLVVIIWVLVLVTSSPSLFSYHVDSLTSMLGGVPPFIDAAVTGNERRGEVHISSTEYQCFENGGRPGELAELQDYLYLAMQLFVPVPVLLCLILMTCVLLLVGKRKAKIVESGLASKAEEQVQKKKEKVPGDLRVSEKFFKK